MQLEIPGFKEYSYPHKPGVYIMKDAQDKVIYIGKAKDLNKRIKSYFFKNKSLIEKENRKTFLLVSRVNKIDYIVTDNEIEAFLLESNLIKRYRPIFNIELKDQQRYTYLKITEEKFPRLQVARRNRNGSFSGGNGEVIGPFVKGSSRYLSVGLLRKMFKIRICNRLPKKECLEYHIGNCDAPCINKVTAQQYLMNIISLKNILNNNNNTLNEFYQKLEKEMKFASERQDYETAIHLRNTLHRLKNLMEYQKIENTTSKYNLEEYIGIIEDDMQKIVHVMMMTSKNGVINDMRKYEFDIIGDNSIESFISQYYYSSPSFPNIIYINKKIRDKIKLEKVLNRLAGFEVKIIYIDITDSIDASNTTEQSKVEDKNLNNNDLIEENSLNIMKLMIKNLFMQIEKQYEPALDDLKEILNLKKTPYVIDCFDISNLGNEYATGACTRFVNGTPNKNGYRRYKIREVAKQNDFQMMEEIIKRRYFKIDKGKDERGYKSEEIPDLIVIDGGKGHLNVALTVLKSIGIKDVQCISLAKENEEVFVSYSDSPINIPKDKKSLKILQHIRDEAHRFGLQYNRKLRKNKLHI